MVQGHENKEYGDEKTKMSCGVTDVKALCLLFSRNTIYCALRLELLLR